MITGLMLIRVHVKCAKSKVTLHNDLTCKAYIQFSSFLIEYIFKRCAGFVKIEVDP